MTLPPGSGRLAGLGVFVTWIVEGTSVISTVASAQSLTSRSDSSVPVTVIRSFTSSPAFPLTAIVNVQVIGALPTARVAGRPSSAGSFPSSGPLQSRSVIGATAPELAGAFVLTLSTKLSAVRVTASDAEVFSTVTVYFTDPPGSLTDVGRGVFVTSIEDGFRSFVKVQVTTSPYATSNAYVRLLRSPPVAPPFPELQETSLK